VFFAQADAIREFAAKGPCVIVGRCADYILRDTPGLLRVFIHSTVEDQKKRGVEFYDVKPEKAEEQIAKIDKIRIAYRKFYTGEAWNDARIYDLAVNTALLGIDGCVDVIAKAARVLEN
jgi:cytidylate kinase